MKLKQTLKQISVMAIPSYAFVIASLVMFTGYGTPKLIELVKNPLGDTVYASTEVNVKNPKRTEPSMREWVLDQVEQAGLNPDEVDCLIQNESGWSNWKYNVNWNNQSVDLGLWQINSIHKDSISVEGRLDYKQATMWSINKRLNDGNWNAWYGWLNNCK